MYLAWRAHASHAPMPSINGLHPSPRQRKQVPQNNAPTTSEAVCCARVYQPFMANPNPSSNPTKPANPNPGSNPAKPSNPNPGSNPVKPSNPAGTASPTTTKDVVLEGGGSALFQFSMMLWIVASLDITFLF